MLSKGNSSTATYMILFTNLDAHAVVNKESGFSLNNKSFLEKSVILVIKFFLKLLYFHSNKK